MRSLLALVVLLLTACSNVPVAIKNAPDPDLQLTQITGNISSYQGQFVRWGGQVIKVDNNDDGAIIEVAQFPLNSYGRPEISKDSEGRFLARTEAFVDPYIFKAGTLLTVAGIVTAGQNVTIDRKTLSLPIVKIKELYRWSASAYRRTPDYWYGYPYYHDYFGYGLHYPGWGSSWRYYHGMYW